MNVNNNLKSDVSIKRISTGPLLMLFAFFLFFENGGLKEFQFALHLTTATFPFSVCSLLGLFISLCFFFPAARYAISFYFPGI